MNEATCLVCGEPTLSPLSAYRALPRVTSDCKPWPAGGELLVCETCGAVQKRPDAAWFDEISRIYGAYDIYHLSDGSEQVIFNPEGGAVARSRVLVDHLVKAIEPAPSGRLIDIGCGNGAAIANFSRALPGWSLSGSELSDGALERLRSIPGFDTLYTVPPRDIPGRFDLVSLIHSLEHMPDPRLSLMEAAGLLDKTGALLVEVPDVETSPFDILVADHLSHFSTATLGLLAHRCGISVRELSNGVLPKELTLIGGRSAPGEESKPDPARGRAIVEGNLSWLSDLLDVARAACAKGRIGIFGTSISAMWLFGAIGDDVSFFVDEDATRVGKSFQGRPILSPAGVPAGERVFVPLAPAIAENVIRRLSSTPASFIAPPPRRV